MEPTMQTETSLPAPEESAAPPAPPEPSPVTFTQVIETNDGYILIGEFRPEVQPGIWVQVTGVPIIHDAGGKNLPYTHPLDIPPPEVNEGSGGFGFAVQFRSAGLAYPLTLSFYGENLSQAEPRA